MPGTSRNAPAKRKGKPVTDETLTLSIVFTPSNPATIGGLDINAVAQALIAALGMDATVHTANIGPG
jgi:hypothetical protein